MLAYFSLPQQDRGLIGKAKMRKLVGRDTDSLTSEGKRKKSNAEAIPLYLPHAGQCSVNAQAMTTMQATPHLLSLPHFSLLYICVTHKK